MTVSREQNFINNYILNNHYKGSAKEVIGWGTPLSTVADVITKGLRFSPVTISIKIFEGGYTASTNLFKRMAEHDKRVEHNRSR